MILALWRYAKLLFIALASMLVFLGRELRPVLVGGYTKNDPRNPLVIARHNAQMEHEMLPGPYRHGDECYVCWQDNAVVSLSSARRHEIFYNYVSESLQNIDSRQFWRCLVCDHMSQYRTLMGTHWRDTGHGNYILYPLGLTSSEGYAIICGHKKDRYRDQTTEYQIKIPEKYLGHKRLKARRPTYDYGPG